MSRDKQNIKTTDWLTKGYSEEELARIKAEAIKEADAELRDKQIEEMRYLADEMGKAISTEIKHQYIQDERKLEEALKANGWRKSADVAEEIFAEIEKRVKASITIHLEEINKEHIIDTPLYDRHSGIIFALRYMEDFIAELKKKYTEEGK